MKLPVAASALALAAALVAAPALAASPGSAPGTGNPSDGGTAGAASQPNPGPGRGGNPATEAGAAGTSATTNPGALGTAPNPGPRPAATGMNGLTAPAGTASAAAQNATPSQRNPVLTKAGRVRASRVIGSAVYDSHDQKIGTIDDILLGAGDQKAGGQQAPTAVISVGGFLGIGSKLVTVPYSKLQFGNTNKNSDNRVVMPDATKAALAGMPSYHYLPGKA